MNNKTIKAIKEMAGGLLWEERIEESDSRVARNPFRVVLRVHGFGIGNLNALKGRGFELLCFGVNEEGKLYIDFDVAAPKVTA